MRMTRWVGRFKRDYKREKKGQHKERLDALLAEVLVLLVEDKPLPPLKKDHALSGNWADHRDCNVLPDLVLIYRKPDDEHLDLVRFGSHGELSL